MQIIPSRHAVETMNARDVSWAQVVETVEQPENTYSTSRRPKDCVHQRGDIAVVTVEVSDGLLVKTVLLRETEQWSNDDARSRHHRKAVLTADRRKRD